MVVFLKDNVTPYELGYIGGYVGEYSRGLLRGMLGVKLLVSLLSIPIIGTLDDPNLTPLKEFRL